MNDAMLGFKAEELYIQSLANQTEAALVEELAPGFSAADSLSSSPTLPNALQTVYSHPSNQAEAAIPNAPNATDALDAFDTPDALDALDTPDALDALDTPDALDALDTPNTPDTPNARDAPDTPDTPDTPDAPDAPPVRNRRLFRSLRRGLQRLRTQLRRGVAPVERFAEASVHPAGDATGNNIAQQRADAGENGSALTWTRESPKSPEGPRQARDSVLRRVFHSIRLRSRRSARERRAWDEVPALGEEEALPVAPSVVSSVSVPSFPVPEHSAGVDDATGGDEIPPIDLRLEKEPHERAEKRRRETLETPQGSRRTRGNALRRVFHSIRVRSRRSARERRASHEEEPLPVAHTIETSILSPAFPVSVHFSGEGNDDEDVPPRKMCGLSVAPTVVPTVPSASSPEHEHFSGEAAGGEDEITPAEMQAGVHGSALTCEPNNPVLEYDTVHIDGEDVNIVSRAVRGDELASDMRHIRENYKRTPYRKGVPCFKGSPPWLNNSDASTVRPPSQG